MGSLEAVFWDLDGTIADTEISGHRIAFNQAFRYHNLDWYWSEKEYIKLLDISGGLNRIEYYCSLQNIKLNISEIKIIHKTKTSYYKNMIANGSITIRTGVLRLINELKGLNITQYIVTTSQRKSVDFLLDKYFPELNSPFRSIISGSDVHHQKPDPEAYLKAISLSGVNTSNIIVIEDSSIGLKAAYAANLSCIITLNKWDNENVLIFQKAKSIVDSLGDQNSFSTVLKGPPVSSYIDPCYLSNLL